MSAKDQDDNIPEKDLASLEAYKEASKLELVLSRLEKIFFQLKVKTINLLDLKGIEEKLPHKIRDKLPQNRRLITLPIFIFLIGFFLIFLLAVFAPSASKRSNNIFCTSC